MKFLQTVSGPVPVTELGLILPHEHLFTDLRGPDSPGYAQGDPQIVVEVMKPFLQEAYDNGVTALIECSTVGVGRNIPVLVKLSEITPIKIIAPTGVYREAFVPVSLRNLSVEELAQRWIKDITEGIRENPDDIPFKIKAGFIKIAMSDDGPKPIEVRNLKAAAIASRVTGVAVASHTIHGSIAKKEMDILEAEGMNLSRFVWVHANNEVNQEFHFEAARRGAFVEFDGIGQSVEADINQINYTKAMIEAGYSHKILLSHDAGWFDPSQPNGEPEFGIRGYTSLVTSFLPQLRTKGITDEVIRQITNINPVQAFGLEK